MTGSGGVGEQNKGGPLIIIARGTGLVKGAQSRKGLEELTGRRWRGSRLQGDGSQATEVGRQRE